MGKVKDVRAADPYTVEFELEEPFSELLPNLPCPASILNEDTSRLGRDFRVKASTARARTASHHGAAQPDPWSRVAPNINGPALLRHQGAAKFEKDRHPRCARGGFAPGGDGSGQLDVTHVPRHCRTSICQVAKIPTLAILHPQPSCATSTRFKVPRERLRRPRAQALSMAVLRKQIAEPGLLRQPSQRHYVHPKRRISIRTTDLSWQYDPAESARLLERPAGKWGRTASATGRQEADLQLYALPADARRRSPRRAGDWRKIGVDCSACGTAR